MRYWKFGHTFIMLRSKYHSFQHIFSTNCFTLFCMRTVLESIVYYNALNIVNLDSILVQINAFEFTHVDISRVNMILCEPPLVWRDSSCLRVVSKHYCTLLDFQFSKLRVLTYIQVYNPLLQRWFVPIYSKLCRSVGST